MQKKKKKLNTSKERGLKVKEKKNNDTSFWFTNYCGIDIEQYCV